MTPRAAAALARVVVIAGLVGGSAGCAQDEAASPTTTVTTTAGPTTTTTATTATTATATNITATTATTTTVPLPQVDDGVNVLLAIADRGECAGAAPGAPSDVVTMIRVEPSTGAVAALSFPSDLWVPIAGTGREGSLSAAFEPAAPTRLVETIETSFGVTTDHYLSMDTCGLAAIAAALRGIPLSFETAVRDTETGFAVAAGCHVLSETEVVTFGRARAMEHADPASSTGWAPTADDQVARQQELMRRLLERAATLVPADPSVLDSLLGAVLSHAVFDTGFTVEVLIEVFSAIGEADANSLPMHRLVGAPQQRGADRVAVPDLSDPQTTSVLDVFSGAAAITAAEPAVPPAEPCE